MRKNKENIKSASGSKLLNGMIWSVIEVLIKRSLDIVVKLILARLLFPEDFGIIGMATVFTSFIQVLSDAGMGMALIQRKEEDLLEEDLCTAFWAGIAWAISLYLIMCFIIAPFAASFYNAPILTQIIPVLSLSLLASSLNTVNRVQLMRSLKFNKFAFINNIASLIAGSVAIILAFIGFGVWALVFNVVIPYFISVPLLFYATKWTPKLICKRDSFVKIFRFGIYTSTTQIVNNISANIDYLIIGKILNAALLGSYTLAYMLTSTVKLQIYSMINRVMYPFYSSIQDDKYRMKTYYLRLIHYNSIITCLIMSLLLVLGKPIVFVFFGEKWVDTIVPMKILAGAMMIDMMTSGYNLLFRSVGNPKMEMNVQIITTLFIYIPLVILGVNYYGIIGVACSIFIARIASFCIAQYLLKKHFNITMRDLFFSLKTSLIASAISIVVVLSLDNLAKINFYILLSIHIIVYITIISIFLKSEIKIAMKKMSKKKI